MSSNNQSASHEQMQRLHSLLLDALLDAFGPGKSPTASTMQCVLAFLKDNGIVADLGDGSAQQRLEDLAKLALPFGQQEKKP